MNQELEKERVYCKEFRMPEFPELTILIEPQKNNSQMITEAINACADQGGGTVVVPAGEWISGPIHFRSNVRLHLEKGAVLSFLSEHQAYLPVVFTRWEGMECYNYSPLIYAKNCDNIAITGEGRLIGNGEHWWHWKTKQQKAATELCYAESEGISVEKRIYGTEEAALRPSFLQTVSCKNVWLEGFTIENGPQWTIHPVYCENVTIRGVKIHTEGPNTDGINPDSCNNVLIEYCDLSTGDDCIAINSGMNEDGWRVNRPCTNVEIRNCRMSGGHGGVVIGSGMSGGIKQILIHDCYITGTMQGIRLKSMRGRGGYVKDVIVENMKIEQVSGEAIQINMYYEYSTVEPKNSLAPDFHNIVLKNITGKGAKTALLIKGLPERKLRNLRLEDITLQAEEAMVCNDVENLIVNNVHLVTNNECLAVKNEQ